MNAADQVCDVEELLAEARPLHTTARIYLRSDLVATREQLRIELVGLLDADGRVTEGADANRAREVATTLRQVEVDLAASERHFTFAGMSSDAWEKFQRQHYPKGKQPDLTEFNTKLIAATSSSPRMTTEQVEKLRGTFGSSQMADMANKAWEACTGTAAPSPAVATLLQMFGSIAAKSDVAG